MISKIDTLQKKKELYHEKERRENIENTLLATKLTTGSRSATTKAPHFMKGNFPDGDMCSALLLISTLQHVGPN